MFQSCSAKWPPTTGSSAYVTTRMMQESVSAFLNFKNMGFYSMVTNRAFDLRTFPSDDLLHLRVVQLFHETSVLLRAQR